MKTKGKIIRYITPKLIERLGHIIDEYGFINPHVNIVFSKKGHRDAIHTKEIIIDTENKILTIGKYNFNILLTEINSRIMLFTVADVETGAIIFQLKANKRHAWELFEYKFDYIELTDKISRLSRTANLRVVESYPGLRIEWNGSSCLEAAWARTIEALGQGATEVNILALEQQWNPRIDFYKKHEEFDGIALGYIATVKDVYDMPIAWAYLRMLRNGYNIGLINTVKKYCTILEKANKKQKDIIEEIIVEDSDGIYSFVEMMEEHGLW